MLDAMIAKKILSESIVLILLINLIFFVIYFENLFFSSSDLIKEQTVYFNWSKVLICLFAIEPEPVTRTIFFFIIPLFKFWNRIHY